MLDGFCLHNLEMSVAVSFSEENRNVERVFALAMKRLTKQLGVLPGNVSFPATESSREFEGLGAAQS